jgi:hypothetical protein
MAAVRSASNCTAASIAPTLVPKAWWPTQVPECSERCCDIVETYHAPHKLVVLTLHTRHPTDGNTSRTREIGTCLLAALIARHPLLILVSLFSTGTFPGHEGCGNYETRPVPPYSPVFFS